MEPRRVLETLRGWRLLAAFLLTVTTLVMYARKQFGKESKRKVARR